MAYAALAKGRAPWRTARHAFFNSVVRPRFAGRGGCGKVRLPEGRATKYRRAPPEDQATMSSRYHDLNSHLRARFGVRVQKISVDAGFTCPNRDGPLGTGGCTYCNARGSGTGAHARGLSIAQQMTTGKNATRRYTRRKVRRLLPGVLEHPRAGRTLRAVYQEALEVADVVGLPSEPGRTASGAGAGAAAGLRPRAADLGRVRSAVRLRPHPRTHRSRPRHGLLPACGCGRPRPSGLPVCAHVILGLPGEGPADMRRTAETLAGVAIDGVKLHQLYVVQGTRLETLYRRGELRCLTQDEYVATRRSISSNASRRPRSCSGWRATRSRRSWWPRPGAWTRPGP